MVFIPRPGHPEILGGSSMPPFLASALALLARGAIGVRGALVGTPARAGITGVGVGSLIPDFGIPGLDFGGGGRPRRRRRRRALTASDRADIGFITGLLGKAAGKEFAIVISTR